MPKFSSWVIFFVPFEEDNALAVYRVLLDSQRISRIFWLVPNSVIFNKNLINKKSRVFNYNSFKGKFYLFFSKTIFLTHSGSQYLIDCNYITVNLWHGFGFKAVGLLNNETNHPATYTIATSDFTKYIIAQEMGVAGDTVLTVGHPRNDLMQNSPLNLNIEGDFTKVVLWMPTYRSENECGGVLNAFNLDNFDINSFIAFLERFNILCVFRSHPLAIIDLNIQSKNFIIGNNNFLKENNCSLYELIGGVDILISDVSSVITDFLILNKPILHAMSDLVVYCKNRNILLKPIDKFFAGSFCQNQIELESEIEFLINGIDKYSDRRIELRNLFYNDISSDSSKKLLKILNLI